MTRSDSTVAVAIDRDKNSQHAVRWAVDNLPVKKNGEIVLIHVHLRNENLNSSMTYASILTFIQPIMWVPCNYILIIFVLLVNLLPRAEPGYPWWKNYTIYIKFFHVFTYLYLYFKFSWWKSWQSCMCDAALIYLGFVKLNCKKLIWVRKKKWKEEQCLQNWCINLMLTKKVLFFLCFDTYHLCSSF